MTIGNIPINALQRTAEAAHRAKNFAQAKSFYICLIGALKQKFGIVSEQLAVNFYKLGEVYSDEGDHEGARTMYHRASELWQNLHRCESVSGADGMIELNRLSDTYSRVLQEADRDQNRGAPSR
jgi:tetratricopeptide (TPR) repeat protein